MEEVKGELTIMDTLGIKPNYCELNMVLIEEQ